MSVCAGAPDLTLAPLPRDVVGAPFDHAGRVSAARWADVVSSRSGRPRDKLYHALKF